MQAEIRDQQGQANTSIQVRRLSSIVSVVNVKCWVMFHDVLCVGNGGEKPTSGLCCRFQNGYKITRASVTCNMYIYFSFLSIVFLFADRKKNIS